MCRFQHPWTGEKNSMYNTEQIYIPYDNMIHDVIFLLAKAVSAHLPFDDQKTVL